MGVHRPKRKAVTVVQKPPVRISPRRGAASHSVNFAEQDETPSSTNSNKENLVRESSRTASSPRKPSSPIHHLPAPIAPKPAGSRSIKLIVEPREDLVLIPKGYELGHIYGGRLTEQQASIKDTTPLVKDRRRFQASQHEAPEVSAPLPEALLLSKKTPEIKCLHLGISNALAPWYSAPFPAEYYTKDGQLWMCEWCLKYLRTQRTMKRHVRKCCGRPPPGNEIYRHGNISVFEVNGRTSKAYCQNLCLLAKMFLDHKTLYYDVETFLFYVLVEWHPIETLSATKKKNATLTNYSLVGYFSKEKHSPSNFNVSCILTLPNHQRKGYGYFLIDFSYLLGRIEGMRCSPEKPLSDLGLVSYVSYWTQKVMRYLDEHRDEPVNVETICDATGMTVNDVLGVLEHHNFVRWAPEKQAYELVIDEDILLSFREKRTSRVCLEAHEYSLRWVPFTCPR